MRFGPPQALKESVYDLKLSTCGEYVYAASGFTVKKFAGWVLRTLPAGCPLCPELGSEALLPGFWS